MRRSDDRAAVSIARAAIERHSRSFAFAARLLPAAVRDDTVILYAYARRADDAIDLAPPAEQPAQLLQLRAELDGIYAGAVQRDPIAAAFQALALALDIPRAYPDELIAGLEMDVSGPRYATLADLILYCHRVAGTVGLMMCRVMGVSDDRALRHADDLGIAMQLTNVCRDVAEDWARDRLYLPEDVLAQCGAAELSRALGGPLPARAIPAVSRAIASLLRLADRYYASGDAGLRYLAPRCAWAVHTARLVYAQIGREIFRGGCDPRSARAVVPPSAKLRLGARASLEVLATFVHARALSAAASRGPRP